MFHAMGRTILRLRDYRVALNSAKQSKPKKQTGEDEQGTPTAETTPTKQQRSKETQKQTAPRNKTIKG